MRNALQPQQPFQSAETAAYGRVARSLPRPAAIRGDFPGRSANDDHFARRDDGEATTLRALAANGFDEAAQLRIGRCRGLAAAELNAAARSDRSQRLGDLIAAAVVAAAGGVRRLVDGVERWRRLRATTEALSGLDDRALRDLGLHRSEIQSIACEIEHRASATRALAAQFPHWR